MEGEFIIMPHPGTERSFAELVQRFGQVVGKTVRYTLHAQARRSWYFSSTFGAGIDNDEVTELTHEVLMLLPAAIRNFRGEAKADTYVATIARNHVMRVLKKRANEGRRRLSMPAQLAANAITVESWIDSLHANVNTEPGFDENLAQIDADKQAISEFERMVALAGLTEAQAEVVRLRRTGFSDKEIATVMGCKQGTVRKRYYDAKEKLRKVYLSDSRWKE
jgi:RNA polymerase sigma factor (sigma-70 family)